MLLKSVFVNSSCIFSLVLCKVTISHFSIINNKKETIIVHNVLGIDKKDLKISLNKESGNTYILIEGKSIDELTKKEYSISSRFALDTAQLDIKNVTSTMKNGLLYITIPLKKEEKENIQIDII